MSNMDKKRVDAYFDGIGAKFSSIYELSPRAEDTAMVLWEDCRITVITQRLIRIETGRDDLTDEPTQTVINRNFCRTDFRVSKKETSLELETEYLKLRAEKGRGIEGISIEVKGCRIWHYGDELSNLGGTARTLDNANGAIDIEPGIISRDGCAILDDSSSLILADAGSLKKRSGSGKDIYFFGYGHDYLSAVRDFYRLTGSTPLLPRFALGNWWSRYYKYTAEIYLKLMDDFKEKDIPISVGVIDMDWHLVDVPEKYGSGWTGYSWNKDYFPDPEGFIKELHSRNIRTSLNMHPADGVRAYEDAYEEIAADMGVNAAEEETVEFDITDRDFITAYFQDLHNPLERQGVDFFWLDWQQGTRTKMEGLDPLWMLNHLHYLDSTKGDSPLIFSRYAGPGSHRYPVGFSGDTITSWESLKFQPYFTAAASNIGYSWWSHDIGGHMMGKRDDELTVRWVQLGIFSPIMRLHSSANYFYAKEPWNYPLTEEAILSDFMRLRHRLIPYLYSMNVLTKREGIPLIRPMYYFHDCPEAYSVENQYYFGDQMIVCPITEKTDAETKTGKVSAWLPDGNYIDLFTGKLYRGGRKMILRRNIRSIPVLVKAGGIIPTDPDYMNAGWRVPDKLTLEIFYGGDGQFSLFEEAVDLSDVPEQIDISCKTTDSGFRIVIDSKKHHSKAKDFIINARALSRPESCRMTIDGVPVRDPDTCYDPKKNIFTIAASVGPSSVAEIDLSLEDTAIRSAGAGELLKSALMEAQIEYTLKEGILRIYESSENTADFLQGLIGFGVRGALLELCADISGI